MESEGESKGSREKERWGESEKKWTAKWEKKKVSDSIEKNKSLEW